MVVFRQKEYGIGGVALSGLSNVGAGLGTAAVGAGQAAIGAGQLGSAAIGAGAGLAGKIAAFGMAHPILSGALAAYGLYRLLKRRRQRRLAERGYSVVEKMYSEGKLRSFSSGVEYKKAIKRVGKRLLKDGVEHYSSESVVEEKRFAWIPAGKRKFLDKVMTKVTPDLMWEPEVLERASKIAQARRDTLKKNITEKVKSKLKSVISKKPQVARAFSDVSDQLSISMPIPKTPREEVPKKIVKKAKKSGVVQRDSNGNWRIINMHGPQGKAIYWKPVYKSKESAENCLRAYQAGKWSKKK